MAAVKPNLNTEPVGRKWAFLTAFTSVNLLTHAEGDGHPARAILVVAAGSGGPVVVKPDGHTETLSGLASGVQIPGQVQSITSGTITSAIVFW